MKKVRMSIDEFFEYCKNEFEYGWIDQDLKRHEGINDAETYYLQSPKELNSNKLGICWDMTELCRDYFENMTDLQYETYYLLYEDYKGCPCHTILVFYKNNKVYWFEPMFKDCFCGIHRYNNINDLLINFSKLWIEYAINEGLIPKDYIDNNILIYKYEKPKYHINGYEMRNHINNSKLIMRGVD